jgi:hypothetical protein
VIEAASSVILGLSAYHWDAMQLWTDDVPRCSWRRSIVDIMAVSVARTLLFMVLLSHSARLLRRATRPIAALCVLSCAWSVFKTASIVRAPGGVPCSADESADAKLPRDGTLALALAILSLCTNVLEVLGLVVLKKMIRKDEQMSAILRQTSQRLPLMGSASEDVEARLSSAGTLSHTHRETGLDGAGNAAGSAGEAAPGNVKMLVDRARPEAMWLLAGCLVLITRLPFSLSLPHFVSETISALILKDFGTARSSIIAFMACGVVDAALDFW